MYKKKYWLVAIPLLLVLISACACSGGSDVVEQNKTYKKVELITNDNRNLVGKQEQGTTAIAKEGQVLEFKKVETQYDSLPDNMKELLAGQDISANSIVGVKVKNNKTPELLIPNGSMGIFYQGKESGWNCKKGDVMEWSFEKYPIVENTDPDAIMNQSLTIGYITNGSMSEGEGYRDLNVTYQFVAPEDGILYLLLWHVV